MRIHYCIAIPKCLCRVLIQYAHWLPKHTFLHIGPKPHLEIQECICLMNPFWRKTSWWFVQRMVLASGLQLWTNTTNLKFLCCVLTWNGCAATRWCILHKWFKASLKICKVCVALMFLLQEYKPVLVAPFPAHKCGDCLSSSHSGYKKSLHPSQVAL